ncbi:M24 family metallopeptidase [Donghicola mangrovi]|uniref:Aminopeptidase P family protein n=1 Tax=Donghicola mangrovi TaxID=2729614 RepID=A0A850Q595_9RHOB|nr:aminopeptidase P family protein [Donghicola mangrovi]
MPDRSLVFPASEYRQRTARLQERMALAGLDALLLTSAADVFYVTGFLTRFWESPARPWFIVVPASGDPVAVIPAIGADLMQRTWIADIRTWPAPVPQDDGITLLTDTLAAITPENGQIGLPMGLETHLRMPLGDYEALRRALSSRQFVDATDVVQRVREIKSDAEVQKIRASCQIADAAYAHVPDFAGQGTPLDQVFRDFQIALLANGADWVSYVAGGAGPNGYGDVISPAAPTPLACGDILMLDTGSVKDGYFCDFDRNFAIGSASDIAKRAHHALWHATEDALNTLRPGHRACDVHRLLTEGITRHGGTPTGGRLGHGLGITLTEWPSFTPLDQTELRAGMVLTLEPGCATENGRMIVHEENLLLTETGPILLSRRAPCDLPDITR